MAHNLVDPLRNDMNATLTEYSRFLSEKLGKVYQQYGETLGQLRNRNREMKQHALDAEKRSRASEAAYKELLASFDMHRQQESMAGRKDEQVGNVMNLLVHENEQLKKENEELRGEVAAAKGREEKWVMERDLWMNLRHVRREIEDESSTSVRAAAASVGTETAATSGLGPNPDSAAEREMEVGLDKDHPILLSNDDGDLHLQIERNREEACLSLIFGVFISDSCVFIDRCNSSRTWI